MEPAFYEKMSQQKDIALFNTEELLSPQEDIPKPVEQRHTRIRWNVQQKKNFAAFIYLFKDEIVSNKRRTTRNFYSLMSLYIGAKNRFQCRTHYRNVIRFKGLQEQLNPETVIQKFVDKQFPPYKNRNNALKKQITSRMAVLTHIQLPKNPNIYQNLRQIGKKMMLLYNSMKQPLKDQDHQKIKAPINDEEYQRARDKINLNT